LDTQYLVSAAVEDTHNGSDALTLITTSDVKFHAIFWPEILKYFMKYFVKYFKNLTMDYGCRLYSSPQQSK